MTNELVFRAITRRSSLRAERLGGVGPRAEHATFLIWQVREELRALVLEGPHNTATSSQVIIIKIVLEGPHNTATSSQV